MHPGEVALSGTIRRRATRLVIFDGARKPIHQARLIAGIQSNKPSQELVRRPAVMLSCNPLELGGQRSVIQKAMQLFKQPTPAEPATERRSAACDERRRSRQRSLLGHLVQRQIGGAKNAHPPRRRGGPIGHPALRRALGEPHQGLGEHQEQFARCPSYRCSCVSSRTMKSHDARRRSASSSLSVLFQVSENVGTRQIKVASPQTRPPRRRCPTCRNRARRPAGSSLARP